MLEQFLGHQAFEISPSGYDEASWPGEAPEDRVRRLALGKARAALRRRNDPAAKNTILLAADTEIVLDGQSLGKPGSPAEARAMLARLSGRTHQVLTGLALIEATTGREVADVVRTDVTFRALSVSEVEEYAESGEPMGKSGAYAIQGRAASFVQAVHGSITNVVGLPLERLAEMLSAELGYPS